LLRSKIYFCQFISYTINNGNNVKINLNDCYIIETIKEDYTVSKFDTVVKHGKNIPMGVFISEQPHFLMPDVHNLSFGRINDSNTLINDKDKLYHQNHSKVFSTIVLAATSFLTNNESKFVGIDGSNNAQAYMYYRCILNNLDYLDEYFTIHGVNYYVRILRKLKDDDEHYPLGY
jgi:hypothetical protein